MFTQRPHRPSCARDNNEKPGICPAWRPAPPWLTPRTNPTERQHELNSGTASRATRDGRPFIAGLTTRLLSLPNPITERYMPRELRPDTVDTGLLFPLNCGRIWKSTAFRKRSPRGVSGSEIRSGSQSGAERRQGGHREFRLSGLPGSRGVRETASPELARIAGLLQANRAADASRVCQSPTRRRRESGRTIRSNGSPHS
jgi:hypothetical protein